LKIELLKRELAKRDYLEFLKYLKPDFTIGPFQQHLASVLQNFVRDIIDKRSPRIIIEAPPRHGKSIQCSEYLSPFLFMFKPRAHILHITYSQTLSDDFGRMVRRTLNDPIFQDLNPRASPDPNTNAIARIDTVDGGMYSALGVGGSATGKGADLLIIDDPIKNEEEARSSKFLDDQWQWYMSVARTRLSPGGGIVIVTTRWTHMDVVGRILATGAANPRADQFKRYSYKALCTDPASDLLSRPLDAPLDSQRYDYTALDTLRHSMSPRAWSALFQQNPVPDDGSFLSIADVERAIKPVAKFPHTNDLTIYLPVDFAIGQKQANDYTVMWPFGMDADDNMWFLPDIVREKITGNAIIDKLLVLADRLKPREIIPEDGHLFRGLRDFLEKRMRERGNYYYLNPVWPSADKTVRAEPLRARLQQGKVFFPDIPLVRDVFFQEAASFGVKATGIHDDMVDAAAIGAARLTKLARPHLSREKSPDAVTEFSYEWLKARNKGSRSGKQGLLRRPTPLNGRER